MTSIVILTAAIALGVEAGWEPLPDGSHEYTIQIEPQLLDSLRNGQQIVSNVPPELHVTRYRVTVGPEKLAQISGQAQPAQPARPAASPEPKPVPLERRQPRAVPKASQEPPQGSRDNPFGTPPADEPDQ